MSDFAQGIESDFGEAVIAGLSAPHKSIPPRYFYDSRGSELFEQITRQPEYYPTRTETMLLKRHAPDLERFVRPNGAVVEFGAGSAAKTPLLLDAVGASTYVAIDISGEFLGDAMARLAAFRPSLRIVQVADDFTRTIALPTLEAPVTGFFPGSTIGNFGHRAAVDLLRSFRQTLGSDARLVIGIDTRKNPRLLEAAYDDAAGITAQFNLNVLRRINRELGGSIPVERFGHRAVWNNDFGRIEMHLIAMEDVEFRAAGRCFSMQCGESIHTENSYKYTVEEARFLARASGWEPAAFWTDADGLFGLHIWAAAPEILQP